VSRGHHVLYEKNNWQGPQNRILRSKPGLIIPLYLDCHSALHKEVENIVTPSYRMGSFILANYRDNPDDHLRSVDNLMGAIDLSLHHPRVRPIERQIGELMIASIEAQLPFIREGLPRKH
jgi:hypothetical protein